MPHYAALLIATKSHASAVDAVREAYRSIGATEGGDHEILVGEPRDGWSIVTDSTVHTIDLGVAAGVAERLKARVLAAAFRGSGSHGKAAAKTFGPWKQTKVPGSLKAAALRKVIDKLGKGLVLAPWELTARPGTTLSFSLARARRTPGPFKTNTPAELRAELQALQAEAARAALDAHLNEHLGGGYADAYRALGAIRDRWGWQHTFDELGDRLFTRPPDLTPDAARLLLFVADRALDGLTSSTSAKRWEHARVSSAWPPRRFPVALAAAAIAGDAERWRDLFARVDPRDRAGAGTTLWERFDDELLEFLSPAMHAVVQRDVPDPSSRAPAAVTVAPVAPRGDAPGLTRFAARAPTYRELPLVADGLETALSIAYLDDRLIVGLGDRIAWFRDGRLEASVPTGRSGGVLHLARGKDGRLVSHAERKVIEVELATRKVTGLWSSSGGETVSSLAVSPGGAWVAFVGDGMGKPGKLCAFGGKRTHAAFGGLDPVAWLDDERLVGAVWSSNKIAIYTVDREGTETCHGGGLRARLHQLVVLAGVPYLATSSGLYRATLGAPRKSSEPGELQPVWTDAEVRGVALHDGKLVAATEDGVLLVDAAGTTHRISPRVATAVAATGDRIACLIDEAGVVELTRA